MAKNLSGEGSLGEVGESMRSVRFAEAAGRLATLFAAVEQRGQMEELRAELERGIAAGEEKVTGKFFEIMGVTPADIHRLYADIALGTELESVVLVKSRLGSVMPPDHIEEWLATENPALTGRRPIDIVVGDDEQAKEELARVISELESPGVS